MLLVLLAQLIISLYSVLTGFIFYRLALTNDSKEHPSISRPLINHFITGLAIITCFAQLANFGFPLNGKIFIAYSFLLIAGVFIFRRDLLLFFSRLQKPRLNVINTLSFLAFGTMVIVIASGPTIMDDTESYHMQLIRWSKTYNTVPGIANLHERYGFQSSWFALSAFFFQAPMSYNFFAALNGTVCIWLSYYLISNISYSSANNKETILAWASFLMLLALTLSWPLLRGSSTNSNYDFIATTVIIILVAQEFEARTINSRSGNELEWILWPAYLFSVRIINYPMLMLLLVSVFYMLRRRQYSQMLRIIIPSLLLAGAMIGRTYISSGYPFFPSMEFDFFEPDWKVPQELVQELLRFIKYYNRASTEYQDLATTKSMGMWGWIPAWFSYLPGFDKVLILIIPIGLLTTTYLVFVKYKGIRVLNFKILFLVILFQIISWFLVAPDPRFSYGALLLIAICPAYFLKNSRFLQKGKILSASILLLSAAVFAYTGKKIVTDNNYKHFLSPIKNPVPEFNTVNVDGIQVVIPKKLGNKWNPRCYCLPLPCTYTLQHKLTHRGSTIADGFKIKKN
ncbi:hypothetical protein [Flavihumibacter sp. ZG627]|uniref:LIC_10190 family membrane protein n=1 Tax=Flavihumibacter sp. ZG627 TaxID=1463156 RepID=UPI00057EC5E1|nr:hypothetical protein [Flavihumibacter sp. ZG627]KIC90348.1 hypothetical protein HY58_10310 [Flavihumibacter sp. ZG627]